MKDRLCEQPVIIRNQIYDFDFNRFLWFFHWIFILITKLYSKNLPKMQFKAKITDVCTLILQTNLRDFQSFYTFFHFWLGIIKVETSGNSFSDKKKGENVRLRL